MNRKFIPFHFVRGIILITIIMGWLSTIFWQENKSTSEKYVNSISYIEALK